MYKKFWVYKMTYQKWQDCVDEGNPLRPVLGEVLNGTWKNNGI